MEQQTAGSERPRADSGPRNEGKLVAEHTGTTEQSGTSGVSDRRRAELERLEAEAGIAHDAADESVPQRREPDSARSAMAVDPVSTPTDPAIINPDIDKR